MSRASVSHGAVTATTWVFMSTVALIWIDAQGQMRIEVKVWRNGRADPLEAGLAQLDGYIQGLGLATGWLVIFDQRSGQPPIAERTSAEPATTPSGRQVTVIRA